MNERLTAVAVAQLAIDNKFQKELSPVAGLLFFFEAGFITIFIQYGNLY